MRRTRTGTAAEKIKRFPPVCYAKYNEERASSLNEMKRGEKVQVVKSVVQTFSRKRVLRSAAAAKRANPKQTEPDRTNEHMHSSTPDVTAAANNTF
jgi:hypothetical protein